MRPFHRIVTSPVVVGAVMLAMAAIAPVAAMAQAAFPAKPIRLIVPFTPGGASDSAARIVGAALSARMGQPFVVENKPGATGNIAAEYVARSRPDGYTLLIVYSGIMTINPFVFDKLPFDAAKDFTFIGTIGDHANAIVVNPAVPAKNLMELIALSKSRDTGLDVGVAGVGTTDQILAMQIAQKTGARFKIVPYKGGGAVMTDLMGGQIPVATSSVSTVSPLVTSGKLRALAVSTAERWPTLPEVPTLSESGIPGLEMTTTQGLAGPAGLPRDVVVRLNAELNAVLATREVKEALLAAGMRAQPGSPETYQGNIRRDNESYGVLIKSLGIKVE